MYEKHHRGNRIRRYLADLFLGLCFIAVGVGYLGNYIEALPWSNFTIFFPFWWLAVFFIIPSIYNLIGHRFSWFWMICLLVSGLILLSKLEIYSLSFKTAAVIFLSVLVILVGLRTIFSPLIKRNRRKRAQRHDRMREGVYFGESTTASASILTYRVCFGERNVRLNQQEFSAATLSVNFGEMSLDLSEAVITDCAVIDVSANFGEVNIRLPENARSEITQSGIASEIIDLRDQPADDGAPIVYVNVECNFGEVVIK